MSPPVLLEPGEQETLRLNVNAKAAGRFLPFRRAIIYGDHVETPGPIPGIIRTLFQLSITLSAAAKARLSQVGFTGYILG